MVDTSNTNPFDLFREEMDNDDVLKCFITLDPNQSQCRS